MEKLFEITGVEDGLLSVGSRVEIFDAERGAEQEETPLRVKRMRVGGNVLVFEKRDGRHPETKAFDPNEGEVVCVERSDGRTRFSVRLQL
jgi:hypothetical protein